MVFKQGVSKEEKETIGLSLIAHLTDAERAFLLIDSFPVPELQEILANILYLGLPKAAEKVLSPKKHEKETITER